MKFTHRQYALRMILEALEHFHDFIAHPTTPNREVLVHGPTGCGKTNILNTVGGLLLQQEAVDTVWTLTSQKDIRDDFVDRKNIHFPPFENVIIPSLDLSNAFRKGGALSTWEDLIVSHLTDPPKSLTDGILVTTHAAGREFLKNRHELFDSIDWMRVLLCIDEVHRAAGDRENPDEVDFFQTEVGRLVLEAEKRGALVLMSSASPFRANRAQVYSEDARIVYVSYQEFVEEAGAPSQLNVTLVSPLESGMRDFSVQTESQLQGGAKYWQEGMGVLSEEDATRLAKNIADRSDVGGKPMMKAFIRIQRVTNTQNVERITQALEREWADRGWVSPRVVDGTGDNPVKFFEKIASEKKVSVEGCFADSTVDFFIVSGRGVEGTDWPLCSHYFNVGFIGTIPFLIQVRGRTTRPKVKDHPFKDESHLVMFLPSLAPALVPKVQATIRDGAALAACYLHSAKTAQRFIDVVDYQIRLGLRKGLRGTRSKRDLARLWSEINHVLPGAPDIAKAEQILAANEVKYRSVTGREISVSDNIKMLLNNPEATDKVKIAGFYLGLKPSMEDDTALSKDQEEVLFGVIDAVVKDLKSKGRRSRKGKSQAFLKAFESAVGRLSCTTSCRLKGQVEIMSTITSKEALGLSAELEQSIVPDPSFPQVKGAVQKWYSAQKYGRKINGNLSPYFTPPLEGSYSAVRLRGDLKRGLLGQPSHIGNLDDLLEWMHLT